MAYKEEGVNLAHSLRGLSPHCGTVARQHTMGESAWMSKGANVMVAVKQREKENTELTNLGLIIPGAFLSSFLRIGPTY